jgi:hypothetical protein
MTRFTTTGLPEDLAAGAVSEHVAAKVMEPASMTMYRWEPGAAQRREHAARPGPPFQIAADKAARLAGIRLAGRCRDPAGVLVHYGLARSWAPPYALVRRDWHTPVVPPRPGPARPCRRSLTRSSLRCPGSVPRTGTVRWSLVCGASWPVLPSVRPLPP